MSGARTPLSPVQQALLETAKELLDLRVAQAEAAFARVQRVLVEDLDVPSDVTGTFQRDGEDVVFVEAGD